MRQVQKEDAVKAFAAAKFRWQSGDVVGRAHHKHVGRMVVQPAQKRAEHPRRHARIAVTIHARERFLDFIDHQHTRSHGVDDLQGLTRAFFRLPDQRTQQTADIQLQQRTSDFLTQRFAELRLAATRWRQQQHTPRSPQRMTALRMPQRPFAECLERGQTTETAEVFPAAMQRQQSTLPQRLRFQLPDRVRGDAFFTNQ